MSDAMTARTACVITRRSFPTGPVSPGAISAERRNRGTARRASLGGFRFIERRLSAGKSGPLRGGRRRARHRGDSRRAVDVHLSPPLEDLPGAPRIFSCHFDLFQPGIPGAGHGPGRNRFLLSGEDRSCPLRGACSQRRRRFHLFSLGHQRKEAKLGDTPRIFCPYVISFASMASALGLETPLLSPVIDFRDPDGVTTAELLRVFGEFGIITGRGERRLRGRREGAGGVLP